MRSSSSWILCLTLVSCVALAGCSPANPDAATKSDTVTIIAGRAGVNLNPYTNVLSTRQVGALLFRGMFSVDASGMPTPDLAVEVPTKENGGMSPDGKEITYKLDPDARWADGEPLTSEDVVFTWRLIESGVLMDDPRGVPTCEVKAVDERTVRLTLAEPDAPFAWRFVPYVLPKHLLQDSPDIVSDDFWLHPVGARERVAGRYIKGTQVDLQDPAKKKATIRVVFAETDAAARKVWDSQNACIWLDSPVGPAGSERGDTVESSRWQAFLMNPSRGRSTAERAVRMAFSSVATVTANPGQAGPYGFPVLDDGVDSEEINADLDRAGWRLGRGGYRHHEDETVTVDVAFNPVNEDEGNRIEYLPLKQYGLKVEPYPTFEYASYASESRLARGDFDVALVQMPIGSPHGWAWPFHSDDIPSDDNPYGLNYARIKDPGLDAAVRSMYRAGSPEALRSALRAAWRRLEIMRFVKWDAALQQTVLYKGVEGVRAEPIEEYALRQADAWRVQGVQAGD